MKKSRYLTEYNEEKERRLEREEGRAEGFDEAITKVVSEMLKKNLPVSLIRDICCLSENAIRSIARSLGITLA